jgi:DNA polymerase I-like protein with 3'-5' exonuclease and polymerase domains
LTKSKLAPLPPHVAEPNPTLYRSNNYVVLDFETTGILKGTPVCPDNRILLSCWRLGPDHKGSQCTQPVSRLGRDSTPVDRVSWSNEFGLDELVRDIEAADFLVAHNAKFELGWLRRCGLDLRGVVVFDTMLGEYVIAGNRFGPQDLGLEKTLKRRGLDGKAGPVNWMIKQGFPVENIPQKWLKKYCERDVSGCEEVFLQQRQELQELALEPIMYQRCLLTPALADIEFNGMQLDVEAVLKLEQEEEERYVTLTNKLTELCEGIEPSKTKQLAEYVYTVLKFNTPRDHRGEPLTTPSGGHSVAAPVMARLVARTKAQSEFLRLHNEWAHTNGRLTKYLRKFGDCCREAGGLLHGVFNQCNTRTHRLSSGGAQYRVQFQNFSRNFKPLFRARQDGWAVGEADGAQLEFRTAVHLGRDQVGLRYIINEDSDIHKFTASVLNNIAEVDVTRDQRQAAKPDTFKPLYGGSSGTPEQQRYYAAFKDQYKGIADTQTRWVQSVLRDKSLVTEWGMRYYWPDTKLQASGYITNSTSIYNYPVQAFATAEIIPCAIVAAWHRMSGMQSFLVNTVHDSIIAELEPSESAAWHDIAQQCLIRDAYGLIEKLYGVRLTVPLGAGVMIGDRWSSSEAKDSEVVYEAPEELWIEEARKEGML